MPRQQLKIYTNQEFKEADKMDRLYMFLIEQERFDHLLLDEEEKYLRVLQKAYTGCFNELRRSAAMRYIQSNIVGYESPARAARLLDDMQELFGRFLEKNLALKQSILVEKMYEDAELLRKLAMKMYKNDNPEGAAKALEQANSVREKAAKIEGLDKVHRNLLPNDIEIPAIIVTSDVKVLEMAAKN